MEYLVREAINWFFRAIFRENQQASVGFRGRPKKLISSFRSLVFYQLPGLPLYPQQSSANEVRE